MRVLGIDFGTTNSVVATIIGDHPEIIPNSEGKRSTPSVVAIRGEEGNCLIGGSAKRQAISNTRNTIYSIKRFLGKKWVEAEPMQ